MMRLFDPAFVAGLTQAAPPSLDADAADYIAAVEAADGQALEAGLKTAINNFVVGCKADGIWDAIMASCILAGARTLPGALVPLKGAAPTSFNFVAGDYNRITGLIGDGSTKYLDSNRAGNADPQDNAHLAAYMTTMNSADPFRGIAGNGLGDSGSTHINSAFSEIAFRNRSSASNRYTSIDIAAVTFVGASRASSANFTVRFLGASQTATQSSQTPLAANHVVFGRNSTAQADGRIAFYSFGTGIGLTALDARVTALVAAIGSALA